MTKRRRRKPEQIVKLLQEGEAMLVAGKTLGEVLQKLEVKESTWMRWKQRYGGKQLRPPTGEGGERPKAVVKRRGQASA